MTDTRGRRVSLAWFRREPYPSIVGVLRDHELLAEGGDASLRLGARLVEAEREAPTGRGVEQVLAQLWIEADAGHLTPGPHGDERRRAAAHDVIDVLAGHRAPT